MKVKNYIVENRDLFINCLEQELCRNNILYVKIDNEIHFLDQLIRFYDYEIDRNLIISLGFLKYEEEMKQRLAIIPATFPKVEELTSELFFSDKRYKSMELLTADIQDELVMPYHTKKQNKQDYQSRNKTTQKYESNMVKQKLKRYKI